MEQAEYTVIKLEQVSESQVPDLIQAQFSSLFDLRKKISEATEHAFDAKEAVINEVGPKAFSKGKSIESLRAATMDLANAQLMVVDAQALSFEYQKKLAETTKYLFSLGLNNIALNRAVVKELEFKLRGAAEGELDEYTYGEIQSLIRRLKLQEDIHERQTKLAQIVREQAEQNESQEDAIKMQAEKDEEHDRRIDDLYAIVVKQDEVIERMLLEIGELRKDILDCKSEITALKEHPAD